MGDVDRRAVTVRTLGVALLAAAIGAASLSDSGERRCLTDRLDALAASATSPSSVPCAAFLPELPLGSTLVASPLASWQTIGGCGAGAGTGSTGVVKWIGRGVTGGEVQVQCQGTVVQLGPGRQDLASTLQISRALTDVWAVGLSVPYLYKSQDHFPRPDLKLENRGIGDLNLMVSRRFGRLGQTVVSLWGGVPTAADEARWQFGAQSQPLPNDLQLGIGRPTLSLIVDHNIDRDWGPIVLGGSVNHRGGTNRLGNSRSPTATAYAYGGYLVGSFVPAVGATMMGALDHDRSLGRVLDNPRLTLALNGSVEWATDWLALLVGFSLPYSRRGPGITAEPWVASAGLALSPF